jgi:UDP-N-acetylglucosamine acyltransferase
MTTERIHPTAIVSKEAEIANDVVIGPFAIVEGKVNIGPGCVLRAYVHLNGPLTLGRGNQLFTGAVLGERPQHARYIDEPTSVEIGDHNIFGEQVSVHRGTTEATRIGTNNIFMTNSHVGHDCQIGDRCFLDSNALIGGHSVLEDNVYLSGNSAVHQFVRLGRLSVLGTTSLATKDLPPFAMNRETNIVCGMNTVGMHQAGHSESEIIAALRAFEILYREGNTLRTALAKIETELAGVAIAQELVQFIRGSKRGIVLGNRYHPFPI